MYVLLVDMTKKFKSAPAPCLNYMHTKMETRVENF